MAKSKKKAKAKKAKVAKSKAKKVAKKTKKTRAKPESRGDRMRKMRDKGMTFEAIAAVFGVSRQRVHQLITEAYATDEHPKEKTPHSHLLRCRGSQRKQEQMENPETLGDRIVYKRLKAGWTLGQLANESGVPYGALSSYENNRAEPSCESLRRLCLALQVSAHWLLFGEQFRKHRRSI